MSLSTAAKDYIATHFGAGTPKCFVSSGITYTDPAGTMQTGSTQDVVATLKMNIGGNARGPGGEVYIDIPDWSSINDADIITIGNEQSGTSQYCYSAGVGCTVGTTRCRTSTVIEKCKAGTPNYWEDFETAQPGFTCQGGAWVPAATKPETGPMEVYVGGGEQCPAGAPSVTLDTTEAFAFYKGTPYKYIGVGGINVHNKSSVCFAYFAWEVRVWDGYGYTTCPLTTPEMTEITRFLATAGSRPLSLTRLDASETDVIWGSFEVLPGMAGEKTICLSLWGNNDYDALIAELNAEGYYDKA